MLKESSKELLQNSTNLLAFSAGVDSTALFFILEDNNIIFDIAIVDYGVREASKEEVAYAKELARKYNKVCYVKNAPTIHTNFEAQARKVRYSFFEELIKQKHYDNLLTAHHLGDRFEWFLMQFCKGAGCIELNSMKEIELRKHYKLIRPLLNLDKEDLLNYLKSNNIKYFVDASNEDERYKRNNFRKHHANPLLRKYKDGIRKSFEYLDKDKNELINEQKIKSFKELAYFKTTSRRSDIYHIDRYLKSIGHIMSASERQQLSTQKTLIIGRKYLVTQLNEYIVIAPYIKSTHFSKEFKEKMRKLKIEPKLRAYLASDKDVELFLSRLLV